MKHLLTLFFLLIAASICHASSNVTFSGGGYDISVLLSDEDCKVVGLNVSGDNGSIMSIETKDLAAFSKAESDCKENNPSRGARNEILSLFRIEKHQQEGPYHCWRKESKNIT